jgi:hypothetical protein
MDPFSATAVSTLHGDREEFRRLTSFICTFTLKARKKKKEKRTLRPLIYEKLQDGKFHGPHALLNRYLGNFFKFQQMSYHFGRQYFTVYKILLIKNKLPERPTN